MLHFDFLTLLLSLLLIMYVYRHYHYVCSLYCVICLMMLLSTNVFCNHCLDYLTNLADGYGQCAVELN